MNSTEKTGASSPQDENQSSDTENEINEPVSTNTSIVTEPTPWPEPVNGAWLLNEIIWLLKRHVSLDEHEYIAVALWLFHAHAHDAAFYSPILAITSPVKRCGKSTLLGIIGQLSPRRLLTTNITLAALFRSIDGYYPTLLVDEADTFLQGKKELHGILNSGHCKSGAYVIRASGKEHEPTMYKVWCPKSIALIGTLPPTLEDRSICVKMKRKGNAVLEKLRGDNGELQELNRKIARWASDNLEALRSIEPFIPDLKNERGEDNWTPLLAIADVIGGEWPEKAREAAIAITNASSEADSEAESITLLSDLRDIFDSNPNTEWLSSKDIAARLTLMEERPWPEYKYRQPITPRQIAGILKPFGISPVQKRLGRVNHRGYFRSSFDDAFSRYLDPKDSTATHATEAKVDRKIPSSLRPLRDASDVADVADNTGSSSLGSGDIVEQPEERFAGADA